MRRRGTTAVTAGEIARRDRWIRSFKNMSARVQEHCGTSLQSHLCSRPSMSQFQREILGDREEAQACEKKVACLLDNHRIRMTITHAEHRAVFTRASGCAKG